MGLFSNLFSNNPITQNEKIKEKYNRRLNDFCNLLYQNGKGHFFEKDFLEYSNVDYKSPDLKLVREILLNAMVDKKIYASFIIYCPRCKHVVLSGSALVKQNAQNQNVINLFVGQVPVEMLDLICPYCGQKMPKEENLQLGANAILYRLDPALIQELQNS